jgi:replicative DNA helicase
MAVPDFGTVRGEKDTDFNDLAKAQGLEVVKACIEKALATDSGPIEARDLFDLVYHEIVDRKNGTKKTTIDTGIGNIDQYTGGLRRGYLTIIAGLPGQGKTAAATGIIVHNSTHGIPCLLFSIEMDRVDIGIRFVSMESGITASHIFDDRHKFDKAGFSKVMDACERLGSSLLTVDDRAVTATQIEEQSHLWFAHSVRAKGHDVGLIVVDYLGLIRSEGEGENRNREVAGMAQRCKLLARTLRSPVILLSQLNREAARRGSEPQLSDLRDSGEIAEAADMVIFPYPAPRDEKGKITENADQKERPTDKWLIAKNRNGGKGALRVNWNPWTMHYTGVAPEPGEQSRDWNDNE